MGLLFPIMMCLLFLSLTGVCFLGIKEVKEGEKIDKFMRTVNKPFSIEERDLLEKKLSKTFPKMNFYDFQYEELKRTVHREDGIVEKENFLVRFTHSNKNAFIAWISEKQTKEFKLKKKTTNV